MAGSFIIQQSKTILAQFHGRRMAAHRNQIDTAMIRAPALTEKMPAIAPRPSCKIEMTNVGGLI